MLCKEFFDQSEYRRHSRIEHAFKCDQESCDYHLENQLSLINHKKKVHFIEPSNSYSSNWKLECEACGKSFAKTKIEWHKTLQHPGACAKYNLDCPLRFVTEAELIRHRKVGHKHSRKSEKTSYQSDRVVKVELLGSLPHSTLSEGSSFPSPRALRPGSPFGQEVYWICYKCGELFTSQLQYNNHVKKDEKHVFPCEEKGCNYVLTTKAMLLKHTWEIHDKAVKVKHCERCQDVVDTKSWAAHDKNLFLREV